jgi:transcriptional regulator with XRE-family HTH domain
MPANETLAQRLKVVASRYSQAEIARRTGTWVSNVHHYLNGTRVPAEFCMALVEKFGVSAQWLLTGEGTPYTADAAPDADHVAGDVMRLSRALDAASRLRFGELFGKQRTRVLAEINDAIDAHHQAQQRVRAQVLKPLEEMLSSAEAAIREHDQGRRDALARASSLSRSARLLLRLADDPEMTRWLNEIECSLAIRESRFADALESARLTFLMAFSVVGPASKYFIDDASTCASAAARLGYYQEARVVLDTALAMARAAGNDPDYSGFEDVLRAWAAAESGSLEGMFELAARGLARVPDSIPVTRTSGAPLVSNIGLMAGELSFEEALDAQPQSLYQRRHLFPWAIWLEDARRLRRLLQAPKGMAPVPEYMERMHQRARESGRFILRAILDGPRGLWKEYERWDGKGPSSGSPQRDAVARAVHSAQVARLCRETAAASKLTLEAEKLLRTLPHGMLPPLLTRAVHYRNALLLGGESARLKSLHNEARQWFFEMVGKGYRCFAGLGV